MILGVRSREDGWNTWIFGGVGVNTWWKDDASVEKKSPHFIDSHQIVVSEQPPDLKPIFSFSLDGVVPRQGLVSVVEVDPKGEERVGGKQSENSRD